MERALNAYERAGVYGRANNPFTIVEPGLAQEQRMAAETDNLGLLGGEIAKAVAVARQQDKAILMTGGNCCHITGIFGGLQDAHGPAVKVGLVWFDAHGDFNTPHTSLSQMLGGMPVAVSAGLAYPRWREMSHIAAPLPTDRIVMVDVRNLDPAEEMLIRATDITIARIADGFHGDVDLATAVADLANRCDVIYFHIDADILDERYVPNHGTREPNGPTLAQVQAGMEIVLATGKVGVLALVSINGEGDGSQTSLNSALDMLAYGLESWQKHGQA
jgi:arginase